MCGVVGIVAQRPVNQALYDALTVLQQRGQDAAGIVTWGEQGLRSRKGQFPNSNQILFYCLTRIKRYRQ